MKLAIMQPYFFPYLGYYQAVAAVDKYMLYDKLAFIKGGWINKNRLLVVNGQTVPITVHVNDKSSFRKINEIELLNRSPWRRKMLNTIYLNYKRCSHFEDVFHMLEGVINSDVALLTELNARSIIDVSRYLDIKTEISTDTSKYSDLEEKLADDQSGLPDRFPSLRLERFERKVVRALEICRTEGADIFINAIGGKELYDKAEFALNNIRLLFVQTGEYSYKQSAEGFHRDLSIIDVLMNCGKEGTKQLLTMYALV